MTSRNRLILCLFALVLVAGCASTKVTNQRLVYDKLPRPNHIFVYDFVSTPADLPPDSAMAGQYAEHSAPQTADDIAAGRELGAQMAVDLVSAIRDMGLPAERGSRQSLVRINDIVIRGYLLSIDKGSVAKRAAIGFGAGASELRTAVEGYQMTAQGLRKLGSGTADAGGSKGPGAAVGAATFIATANPAGLIVSSGMKVYGEASGKSKIEGRADATVKEIAAKLKTRFQEEGWIQ
ncbi:MAG: hypothetical protein H6Q33_1957 [Deltaproteobacteria bacterium]|nr:hypothetical protein [Deltaproteobacteria bacterium]